MLPSGELNNLIPEPLLVPKFHGDRCNRMSINPLIPTLKPQRNGPLYSNAVTGTLVVYGWVVTFGTVSRCGYLVIAKEINKFF